MLATRRDRAVAFLAAAVIALAAAPVAHSSLADERALAEKHAPVVRLVKQEEECGPGEPYEPIDVAALFDEPTVALRGPWNAVDLIKVGPSEADVGRGLYEHHLDFPGHALNPGCTYERWARRVTEGREPTVYAHVASDRGYPGKLALQYWLFYAYNDWNNLHEGDWEMIQLVFEADDAREALTGDPVSIGYSQHEGAERADWDDDKLELVEGRHPVVHPAAGSHANFFDEALYLGSSGSQGVGCDDTSGPTRSLSPIVRTIPSDPAAAREAFPWIGFEGRWGELQEAFFNGPTGPNLKRQWTEPIAWSEDWRDRSYAVPAGGALGTGATDFFCGAVAGGSELLRRTLDEPGPVLALLAVLLALVLFGVSRATWRPASPLRVAHRRAWGQILGASAKLYVKRFPLFVGLGLVFLPIASFIALLQAVVLRASSFVGIETDGEGGGLLVLLVIAVSTSLTLLGVGLVQAATARALLELDRGRRVGPLHAYRLAFGAAVPLLGALAVAAVAISLLAGLVILLPIALWLAIRWALIAPVIELEDLSAVDGLRRSGRLVGHEWLKVASLIVVAGGLALIAGPLLGALLIVFTEAPLALLNVVAGVVHALTIPFVALTTAYVYFDTRVRDELEPASQSEELPAEIEL